MRKALFRLFCALLTVLSLVSMQEIMLASSLRGNIIIISQIPTTSEKPRTPVRIPFIAELMDGSNSVILGATENIGTVSVQITSTAGDYYSTSFDTTDGAILLPISGDAGLYTLRITTSGGLQFVGEFTI